MLPVIFALPTTKAMIPDYLVSVLHESMLKIQSHNLYVNIGSITET